MISERIKSDLAIVGARVFGFSIGIAYLNANSGRKAVIADKEDQIGKHASGRNSGVLHTGFYYSPKSLKAKFCREGNVELRKIAKKYSILICHVGKVVVARNSEEILRQGNLFGRGLQNGVDLELLDEESIKQFEPLAQTTSRFLWSPTTAVSNPGMMIRALQKEFEHISGKVTLNTKVELVEIFGMIHENSKVLDAKFIVNAVGTQAGRISRHINVGLEYAMLPFMGVYRTSKQSQLPLQPLVYPVPQSKNPFLGVHCTLTTDWLVKIGPTAIPVFDREQYVFHTGWSVSDSIQAMKGLIALIKGASNNFGAILKSEWLKVILKRLVQESTEFVTSSHNVKRWHEKPPGIRVQLVHLPSGKLVQDYVAKKYLNSVHVLNAVPPGWTSVLPLGKCHVD
jgi:(S)-2-hydroxyglutarate dehydrogenase